MLNFSRFRGPDDEVNDVEGLLSEVLTYVRFFVDGIYPPPEPEMRALKALINDGDRCLDVGAHYGYYTVPMAQIAGDSGSVIAFEPFPQNYEILDGVIQGFELKTVTTINAGLYSDDRETVMGLPPWGHDWKDSHGLPYGLARIDPPADWVSQIPVSLFRYDDYDALKGLPLNFVKIDVEGSEYEVISGMSEALRASRPHLLVEIEERHLEERERDSESIFRLLNGFGYLGYVLIDGLVNRGLYQTDGIMESHNNYFFFTTESAREMGLL